MSTSPAREHRVIYRDTVRGLFVDILGPRLTPELKAELRAVGLDVDDIGMGCNLDAFERALEVAWRRLYPELSRDDAMAILGELQVDAFANTLLGKTSFAFLRLVGMRRALERITSTWRSANNFVRATVVEHSPELLEIQVNVVGQGHASGILGILRGAVRHLGWPAKTVRLGSPQGEEGHSYFVDLLR